MLKNINHSASRFFDILPEDWQQSIVPNWEALKNNAQVYVIENDREILVGGIVFSGLIPEMKPYVKEAQQWFSNDYLYIGYLWVPEKERGKNLGSIWLKELRELDKHQKYWLTIEEEGLSQFYLKNSFKHIKTLAVNDSKEELFAD